MPAVYIQQERYLNASGYYLYPGAFNHTQIPVNITEQLYRERQRSSNTAQPVSTAEEDPNVDINPRVVYHGKNQKITRFAQFFFFSLFKIFFLNSLY